jgi:UDP-glucose 4-epimerase
MAQFLVTGGCGFIGSHLAAALLARGDTVRVLDDLSTGRLENLAPGASLVIGSVTSAEVVRDAMRGVDGCFHLAAIASVARGNEAWLATHHTNLSGTIAVLDAARAGGGRSAAIPVVYASSAAIYGVPEACPLAEGAPARPLSAYGADKLGCELHARVAGQVHGVPTLGLRFFNVFGPRQDPGSPYSGVVSIFCDRVLRGLPVSVFGDGGQTRDFVFVADVVAALLAALPAASTVAPVFNVCTGRPTSLLELLAALGTLCGTAPRARHLAARSGDIRHSVGAPGLARAALGLGPGTELAAGLRQLLGWMRAGRPGLAPAGPRPAAGLRSQPWPTGVSVRHLEPDPREFRPKHPVNHPASF